MAIQKTPSDEVLEYINHYMEYSQETGRLTWKNLKPYKAKYKNNGNDVGRIYTIRKFDYNLTKITINGKMTSVMTNRIVWYFATGEWPTGGVIHVDENPRDLSVDNLASVDPRTRHVICYLKNLNNLPKPRKTITGRWETNLRDHKTGKMTQWSDSSWEGLMNSLYERRDNRIAQLEAQKTLLSEVIEQGNDE